MVEPSIIVRRGRLITVRPVEQRERDTSTTPMLTYSGDLVSLRTGERAGNERSIESDGARDLETEAKPEPAPAASPDDVDLDELMGKLKALAAKAKQVPRSRASHKRLVTVAAIALSITSCAVTAQYLTPGHSRAPAAPSTASAAPVLAAPAAPAPVELAAVVPTAPPPAAAALEHDAPAAAIEPPSQAVADTSIAPVQPDAEATTQSAAISEAKPAAAAEPQHAAPRTAATHSPPAAQGNAAGRFRVQFGAFANADNARRVQAAIAATGLKVEISHDPGPSGNPLFFVRSPSYPDRASAISAAQTAQRRAQHLASPVGIDYAIIPGRAASQQQARL